MKLPLGMVACLLVAACSSTSTAAVTPNPTPTPAVSVPGPTVLPSTSASPTASDLPLSQVGFSCRLPVMVETTGANPVWFQGGFVTFAQAAFAPDPRGRINSTGGGSVLTTAQAPVLNGAPTTGFPYFDAAQNRWLPVSAAQSSSDGSSYAYAALGEKTIHVVSVATGTERVFSADAAATSPGAIGVAVLDFEGASVYFAAAYPDGPPTGLWRLDSATGAVSRVTQLANVFAVRGGAAWAGYLDPQDPNPPTAASGAPVFNSLVRVDLVTGQRTVWDYRPGHTLVVRAVDPGGEVVIAVSDPSGGADDEIRLLSGPVSGGEENGDLVYSGPMTYDAVLVDGDRLWLGNDRGVYIYTSAAGLQKVYPLAPKPGTSILPAGPCR